MFGVYALGSIFITMFGSTRWYQLSMPPPHHRSSHSLATCGMCDRKIGTLQTACVPYGRMVGTFVACENCADDAYKRSFDCGTSHWEEVFESAMRNRSEDTQPNKGTLLTVRKENGEHFHFESFTFKRSLLKPFTFSPPSCPDPLCPLPYWVCQGKGESSCRCECGETRSPTQRRLPADA